MLAELDEISDEIGGLSPVPVEVSVEAVEELVALVSPEVVALEILSLEFREEASLVVLEPRPE